MASDCLGIRPEGVQVEGAGAATARRARILIVDDDEDFLAFIRCAFDERYEVLTAPNGVVALEIVAAREPQLIVTDICMPKMSGFQLIRELQKRPAIPIIAISGYDIMQSAYDISSLVADAVIKVIRKPCEIGEVARATEAILNLQTRVVRRAV